MLNKSKHWLLFGALVFVLVVAGCAPAAQGESEATSPPDPAEESAATDGPADESAPTDAAEADTGADLEFSETVELPIAGYSFQLVSGSLVDVIDGEDGEAVVSQPEGGDRMLIALRAVPAGDGRSSQQVIDDYVQDLVTNEITPYTVELGEPFETTVGGHEALAVDIISGTVVGNPILGQIIVIDLGDGLRVRVFGLAELSENGSLWEEKAEAHYMATIGTLQALGD